MVLDLGVSHLPTPVFLLVHPPATPPCGPPRGGRGSRMRVLPVVLAALAAGCLDVTAPDLEPVPTPPDMRGTIVVRPAEDPGAA